MERTTLETYFDMDQDFDMEIETTFVDGQKIVRINVYNISGKKIFSTLAYHQHTYTQEY